jgi:hypothetical protein
VVYFAISEASSVALPKGNAVTRVDKQLAKEWCKGGGMSGVWVVLGGVWVVVSGVWVVVSGVWVKASHLSAICLQMGSMLAYR